MRLRAQVYCDNFLSTIDFTIAAVPMEPSDRNENSAKRVAAMSSVADELKEKKVVRFSSYLLKETCFPLPPFLFISRTCL